MASDPNQTVLVNKTDARQGSNKPKLIYVLVAGIALVLIAFTAASFIH